MRILVTGSQGTLGKPLIAELRKRGHAVTGCDLSHGEIGEIRCDVSEARQVESAFQQVNPEVVYHLGAEFGRINGAHYPEQLWKSNCLGTQNVIEGCVKHKAHLVFASSSEAYGNLADKGVLYESLLDTDVPRFHNIYALSKWTNEKQIQISIKNDGLRATILRFFNVYGPGEEYNEYRSVVCRFIYKLMKGDPITVYEKTHRSFMYIDDWTAAVANVATRLDRLHNGESINIGSPEYVSLKELQELIVEVLGGTESVITLIDTEIANIKDKMPHTKRAECALNLSNSVDLGVGIQRTVAWMRDMYRD